jgi:hypothetical protein
LYLVADSVGTFKGFSLEDGRSIGLKSESRDTSEDGVSVEELDSLEDLLAGVTVLQEIDSVLTEEVSLIFIASELSDVRESGGGDLGEHLVREY